LPPLERWRGVRPIKAANSRPLAKDATSPTVATTAVAITGPTPGIVINRRAFSSVLTVTTNFSSITAIA
jgi:hypothetical protein